MKYIVSINFKEFGSTFVVLISRQYIDGVGQSWVALLSFCQVIVSAWGWRVGQINMDQNIQMGRPGGGESMGDSCIYITVGASYL